ncbi:MAG: hypothetical protein WCX64_00595 [Candidatus Micrarchaeia archaeon]|jgi:uncharacterized protein (UPF0333 family)
MMERAQTSLEYLLILAGAIMLVLLVAQVITGAMLPYNSANNAAVATVWPTGMNG